MYRIYSHPHAFMVEMAKDRLTAAHIYCEIRNQFSQGAAGELAPADTWVELWIGNEQHLAQAQSLLASLMAPSQAPDWLCLNCQETNDPSFECCWQCGQSQAPSAD